MVRTLPHNKTQQTYAISACLLILDILYMCAFHLRNSTTGLREAHTNSIFSLAISVLEYYTVRNVMSCFSARSD